MSDFLTEFLAEGPVVKRPVPLGGRKGDVYFKRLSLPELIQLGQLRDEAADEEARAHSVEMMVHFAVCNPDGSRRFPTVEDARALGGAALFALCKVANEVNGAAVDLGKA